MIKFFSLLFAVVMMATVANAQDVPTSVGPAPGSNYKVTLQEPTPFQVGTRAFTQISTTPTFQFGKCFMETCTITNIGTAFTITFPGGLLYRNGLVYTYNQSAPNQLWQIDTVTGVHTFIVNLTGTTQGNLTGMCWDGTTVYCVSTSVTASQIYTVNLVTGVCTPIGTPSAACAGAINLMCRQGGAAYSLFSTDIVLDNTYRWNKATGVATLVGPIGTNTNFGQDGSCDTRDGQYYLMIYDTGPALKKLDTATGAAGPALCTYTAQATGICFVPSGPPPPPPTQTVTLCRNGINVAVPDNSAVGIRDTIKMIGNTFCPITDINLKLDTFLHTWDSDMSFTLNHLATTTALITNRGSSGDNFIGTILNDSAANPISSGTAPFTGSFRPEVPLTAFNGHLATGNWVMFMADNAAGDVGFLKAWCITFEMQCPLGGVQTVEVPFAYKLSQNYPNPFNPVTTIKYGLPKYGNTKLVVYNITGQVVKTLVDEFKDAGTYEVTFDAANFASGVYFYTLESGSFKETKKMLLVK